MISTIVGALLPIVITLIFGFIAAWHHDFDGKQATVLNRMVMLYALPLNLFAGMVATSRSQLASQVPLALSVFLSMIIAFGAAYVIIRYVFRREPMTAALQALAIGGPAVPFVGVSVLGYLFGDSSAVSITSAGLAMNLIQVPLCMILLSVGAASRARSMPTTSAVGGRPAMHLPPESSANPTLVSFGAHVLAALKEPVVWAPVLAIVLVLIGLRLPPSVGASAKLLGSATGGVALFASGIVLFSRRVVFNLPVAMTLLCRNLIVPSLTWAAISALGMPSALIKEAVVTVAIPVASITVILAVQYQAAEQETASALFFSTIASVVTMGLFIGFLS